MDDVKTALGRALRPRKDGEVGCDADLLELCRVVEEVAVLSNVGREDESTLGRAVQALSFLTVHPSLESGVGVPLSHRLDAESARLFTSLQGEADVGHLRRGLEVLLCVWRSPAQRRLLLERGLLGDLLVGLLQLQRSDGRPSDQLTAVVAATPPAVIIGELLRLQRGAPAWLQAFLGPLLSRALSGNGGLGNFLRAATGLAGEATLRKVEFIATLVSVVARRPKDANGYPTNIGDQTLSLLCDPRTPDSWNPFLVHLLYRLWAIYASELRGLLETRLVSPVFACTCAGGLSGLPLPSTSSLTGAIHLSALLSTLKPAGEEATLFGAEQRPLLGVLFSALCAVHASKFPVVGDLRACMQGLLEADEDGSVLLDLLSGGLEAPRPELVFQSSGVGLELGIRVREESSEDRGWDGRARLGIGLSRGLPSLLAQCLIRVCEETDPAREADSERVGRLLTAERVLSLILDHFQDNILESPTASLVATKMILKRILADKNETLAERALPIVTGIMTSVVMALTMSGSSSAETEMRAVEEIRVLVHSATQRWGGQRIGELCVGLEEVMEALRAPGVAGLSELERALAELRSPLPSTQGHALIALGRLARQGDPPTLKADLFPDILEALESSDSYVFLCAIRCLAELGSRRAAETTELLLPLFLDPPPSQPMATRFKIGEVLCQLLAKLGEASRSQVGSALCDAVLSLCGGSSAEARVSGFSCLGSLLRVAFPRLLGSLCEVSAALEGGLGAADAELRLAALEALRGLAVGAGDAAVEALGTALGPLYKTSLELWARDEDPRVCLQAQLACEDLDACIKAALAPPKAPLAPHSLITPF